MKSVKMLGLAAVAAAALMAFVGASSASATVLCKTVTNNGKCPVGWAYTGEIHAVLEEPSVTTGGFKNIECGSSTIVMNPQNEGSATETVKGPAVMVSPGNCNCEVVVAESGSLEIHWTAGTNGTVTSTGLKETVNCSTIFGNVHCIYVTNATDLGTLTGSSTTGATATLDITANIPRESTNSLCSEEAIWHAKYSVTSPDYLDVGEATG